jgi:hypothetical protein
VFCDTAGLADALAAGPTAFTVQADHTVIAPPGLDADLDSTLSRIAALESDAGARIYRITDASIGSALDTGMDAAAILAFLHEHSTVEIAANVERTVRDAEARHGQIRIGSAVTWIACDDPMQLVRAVGVKSAKLTVVSPTAAVSPLAEDKVLAALRAKGVAPTRADAAKEPKARLRRHTSGADLEPRASILDDLSTIDILAKQLLDAPRPSLTLAHATTSKERLAARIAEMEAHRRGASIGARLDPWDAADDDDGDDDELEELDARDYLGDLDQVVTRFDQRRHRR